MIVRSSKVNSAIKSMTNFVNQKYYNGITADEMKTILEYIETLEQDNKIQRQQLNDAFSNGFIHIDLIKKEIDKLLDIGEDSAANLLKLFLEDYNGRK